MDVFNLTYTQILGILTFGFGIMLCFCISPKRKKSFEEEPIINRNPESRREIIESPKKRIRATSSMEKLNVYFDVEENKPEASSLTSRSTNNILNEREFELKTIKINFEKYKMVCGICKTLIPQSKTLYCYMDNRFCSEECREHFYKVKNDEYKRRFSL